MSYKYDAAFSFLTQNQTVAERLHGLISPAFTSFLYTERQPEIAGRDGELAYNDVFAKQARVVVILSRKGWGDTSFTQYERIAIQNRAYSDGYGFVVLIPMDQPATIPVWIPKNYVWLDYYRFGDQAAAAVIAARIREAGGELHEETPEEMLARANRDLAMQRESKDLLALTASRWHGRK